MGTHKRCDYAKKTASGAISSGPCFFYGYLVGMDGVNDVRASFHDGADQNATEVVPSNTYDASALNANGALWSVPVYCQTGLYLYVESGSNYEITAYYVSLPNAHEARHWAV